MPSVVIAEDHSLTMYGMKSWVQAQPQLQLVGTAVTGIEALQMCLELNPNLLLLDLGLPNLNGFEILQKLAKVKIPIKVLVVSTYISPARIERCLKFGASGFINKAADLQVFGAAVQEILAGNIFIDPSVSDSMSHLANIQNSSAIENGARNLEELTEREVEILKLNAQGLQRKEIAEKLFISNNTVKTHLNKIFDKLDVNNVVDAIRVAQQLGFIGDLSMIDL